MRLKDILQRFRQALGRIRARLLSLQDAPRKIALGFALGILIGMTPFWGVHIPTSFLAAVVLRCSKIAAIAGVQITNVGTAPLIYPVNYWVGVKLVGVSQQVDWPQALDYHQMFQLFEQSPLILVDLCIGGLILGLPLAVIGYFTAFRVMQTLRRRSRALSPGVN